MGVHVGTSIDYGFVAIGFVAVVVAVVLGAVNFGQANSLADPSHASLVAQLATMRWDAVVNRRKLSDMELELNNTKLELNSTQLELNSTQLELSNKNTNPVIAFGQSIFGTPFASTGGTYTKT